MKTFQEFMIICEATYDKDVMSSSQIRRTGEGGRIGAERKKSTPERRRMKAVGGGKMVPVEYKPRKDIGTQRQASTRVQQPTQERGSADVKAKAAAAAKEERKKAALARIAAKKSGGEAPAAEKPKGKEVAKTATKLLSTKKPEAAKPASTEPKKPASGKTRAERDKERNAAMRAAYNKKKEQVFADYEKVHGSKPKGKERTKLIGLINREAPAHPSSAAKSKAQ
jgi:membrane protein involved in colicin uptake